MENNVEVFARKCSVTGEGMNEGWCFGDGEQYAKYEKDAIQIALRRGNDSLGQAVEEDDCYWTEWDVENDAEYYKATDGTIREIEE